VRTLWTLVRNTAVRYGRDGCGFFAQALAFNAIFAVFPILILTIALLGYIYGDAQGQQKALSLVGNLAPELRGVFAMNLRHVVAFRGISGFIAIAALLWSGKNLFQGLAFALNRALDVPSGRPLVIDILIALVMIPIVGVLFIVATTVPLALSIAVEYGNFQHAQTIAQLAGYGTGVLLIFAIAVVLYAYLPNRRVGLRFGVPGAVFVTVAWEIAQIVFAFYSTHVNFRLVYGALGALALLLLWFYYMACIFLFGAELSAEWSRRVTKRTA
jgi:membrane protein